MAAPAFRLVPASAEEAQTAQGAWDNLSDEELFALTCEGERDAFQLLVERYEGKAIHTARSIVGSYETAREVAQDTFLKVYAARERFDQKRKFSTWFYRILRNQAVDRVRRTAAGTPGGTVELVGDWNGSDSGPVATASETERKSLVRRVLDALPHQFREVLILRDLQSLSCAEIGERVGATPGTVRWRLHHARKLFRDQWERTLGREEGGEVL
ncbi:MAG: sigma-70 family RNA polymerase sigma factor [Planctomycetota bacterium]|nr:sigma-70 family RNA polymerase sigma factor [Planctomycetota bacterium]MDA1112986.1 sigma-70 family RNA polymerase sigma factor [Planctomycetota bacterium]